VQVPLTAPPRPESSAGTAAGEVLEARDPALSMNDRYPIMVSLRADGCAVRTRRALAGDPSERPVPS